MQYGLILVKSLVIFLNHALLGVHLCQPSINIMDLIAYTIKSIILVGLID